MADYPPMHPMWAAGFQRQNGRPPSQGDWNKYIDFVRRGRQPEETTAGAVAPYAGLVGSALGMYGASKLPGIIGRLTNASKGTEAAKEGGGLLSSLFGGSTGGGSTVGTGTFGAPMSVIPETAPTIGGTLAAAAPWAAGIGGAAGLYDVISNFNDMSQTRGGIQGGLSGAALGFALGGPVGAAIGLAAGGGLGLFAHKPQTQVEEGRWKDLGDDGYPIPDWVKNGVDIKAKGAGSRPDLEADFVGYAPTEGDAVGFGHVPSGTWVNNKFAQSRNEADLRPEDIWGYAAMPELFGKDYMATSEANRRAISQKALDLGLVDEHHGTIDIKDTPELQDYWKSLFALKAEEVKDAEKRLFYNK